MLIGGFMGFAIGLGLGLAQNSPWPSMIWHAAAATLISAALMRWWGRVWTRAMTEAMVEKQAAQEAQAKSNPPSNPLRKRL